MTLIRVQHNSNYTCINNTIASDSRLSWKAKGIFLYAFSRPDDWTFYVTDLINKSTDGKTSVYSGLDELEEAGYLTREQRRMDDGKFGSGDYVFHEVPQLKKKQPQTGFPDTVKSDPVDSDADNEPLLSTERTSTQGTSTEKNKEESLLRSTKMNKKDFTQSLDEHQKKAFNKVRNTIPEWGDFVKLTDITYWLLKLKGGGAKRVEEALEVYLQDVPKAKAAGKRIESMGAYIRSVLDSGRKPNHEHFDRNKAYADLVAAKNKFVKPKQQYVTIDSYINESVPYSLPESTFKQTIDSYVNKCKEYE